MIVPTEQLLPKSTSPDLLHSYYENVGESCRAVDSAMLVSGTNQGLQIVANVSFLAYVAGCLRHRY